MKRRLSALTLSLTFTACSGADSDLPEAYRRLDVPEVRLRSPEARASGRRLFLANCVLCHGERGDGHGMRSVGFAKAPANFTDPAWRRGVTARRVFFVIREGVHGTPMPAWNWLSTDEAWDLVAYLLSLGPTPAPRATTSAPVAGGRRQSRAAGPGAAPAPPRLSAAIARRS